MERRRTRLWWRFLRTALLLRKIMRTQRLRETTTTSTTNNRAAIGAGKDSAAARFVVWFEPHPVQLLIIALPERKKKKNPNKYF
jgi:hypothetical protein